MIVFCLPHCHIAIPEEEKLDVAKIIMTFFWCIMSPKIFYEMPLLCVGTYCHCTIVHFSMGIIVSSNHYVVQTQKQKVGYH